MKLDKLFPNLLLTSAIPLTMAILFATPTRAETVGQDKIKLPVTNARIIAQTSAPTQQTLILITGVKANSTEKGVEVILETTQGEQLQVTNRSTGNNFIADITTGQLQLPNGDAFTYRSEKPINGITEITVANLDANTVRVTVVGEKALPAVELFDDDAGLILAVESTTTATQPPATPTSDAPPAEPIAQQDDPIELVVTGEQDRYRVPTASTATKTDTPVRDIPGSIQVIPRQILEDQKTTRIQEVLQNVSGVNKQGNYGGTDAGGYRIRGFDQDGNFRNGFNDTDFYSLVDTANIDRIEVLKGPASVLFGQAEPGGIINVVTKQPLRTPYYAAELNVGNYAFYRPSFDISGPLTDDGSLLYRLNVAYQNSGSFRDYNFLERVFVAPVITWNISDRTSLTFDLEYQDNDYLFDRGIPSIGDRPAPIPISRFVGLPHVYNDSTFRIGYRLEHDFSKDWQLRNAFSFVSGKSSGTYAYGGYDLIDDQFAPIYVSRDEFTRDIYTLQTEVVGKFKTGSIVHQPLIGVELRRNTWKYTSFDVADPILLDIFNPNYDVELPATPDESTFSYTTRRDTLGIYVQDQITFADNLKLLVGGRFDAFQRKEEGFSETASEESLSAFSPRIGIVYQPIQAISLYASYSQSFKPDRFFGRSASNEPFKPTRGTQYEVGIKADISEKLSATLAAYEITKTNVVTSDPNDPNLSVQVGEQRSRGIELDIGGEIVPGWNIIASYTYTDAITSKDNTIPVGNRIDNVPEHAASLWTSYELQSGDLKGLGFGLGLYYVGDRYADVENTSLLSSYFRTDSAIYYKRDNWRLALNFRNLFNETYYETSQARNTIYPGAPFTVIGSFSIQF
ncbi:TonB-dependent siderophore receptor [Anabaena sp. FACHB-709]|uniref:Ferrichrome-iron receptor n=2 Tax=Nostocaceae TaxID=1162 RepID=A0A1Z4KGZ9_ANAVA|nr:MULTISPECIES: TonB-dependent siderophore receptor [Nostocaceae]BAY68217.1 ferrichrome-iron receptor [Trichormus variabilis NIES-23]HBW29955.1 TonB-dependent siderophore receptor [Nostoc sp. UBA8866]MBD2169701.1 TonB-dependent siderophore receptor [Anabaena cylindrica FACHB-318]MBD2261880.1 TonB-dependent siderophore receptor [Anabaena sp. FACHB-709]MBD2271465.1 TonB-dependent siderophore receptor [Nostoc sp. PCC 7120 = FACHB-418]